MKDLFDEEPPFNLDEAKEWLLRLEDIATIERDLGFATRLVLVNLFRLLSEGSAVDGMAFIDLIRRNAYQIPAANERLATRVLLLELEQTLSPESDGGGFFVPGSGSVH